MRSLVRRRIFAAGLVVALLMVGGVAAAPAEARTYRVRLLDMINNSRDRQGLDAVKLKVRLSGDARHHSRMMIRRDELFDVPNLATLLKPYHWTWAGALVGCSGSLYRLHRTILSDPAHRGIVLSEDARWVGIGALRIEGKSSCGRGAYWVTEILYG